MKIIINIFMLFSLALGNDDEKGILKLVDDAKMDSLVLEANAVVLNEVNIVIVEDNEISHKVSIRYQINNHHGDKYCNKIFESSDFIHINDIEAVIKDLTGNIIKELDSDDIEEFFFHSGYEVKQNRFSLYHQTYPYIFELEYEIVSNSHFFWPNWYPQNDIPTVSSSYRLILEDDIPYKTFNIGIYENPEKYVEDGDSVHLWNVRNIPPIKDKDYLPPEHEIQNAVLFAPLNFEIGKSKGSFQSWDDIAAWYRSLAKGRYEIPEFAKKEVQELIKGVSDKHEIIDFLYRYLQNKTRYIMIYLGIGGWQPHEAEWVYNNRFGDCKDLSTLMIGLLNEAGIKAYPALAKFRSFGVVYEDFPSSQFNHVIAFVPLENDSLWLECTADFIGYNDIPYSIEGINVLVIKDDKGELIKTPQKSAKENKWHSKSVGKISSQGTLSFESKIIITGNQKRWYQDKIPVLKSDELDRRLIKDFSSYLQNFNLADYSFSDNKNTNALHLDISGQYKKFSKKVGKRLFLNPNILNRKSQKYIPDDINRLYPIKMGPYPYVDIDSLEISIPSGYIVESAPEIKNIITPFGKYRTSYKLENDKFTYLREFEFTKILIDPSEFDELVKFYQTAIETDKANFVFKKE